MDTLIISPETQEKATPIADTFKAQLEVIREGLADNVHELLGTLKPIQVHNIASWLRQTPILSYDSTGFPQPWYYFSDIVQYKYGWKVCKTPALGDEEMIYTKDLPLVDLMEILKAIERFM